VADLLGELFEQLTAAGDQQDVEPARRQLTGVLSPELLRGSGDQNPGTVTSAEFFVHDAHRILESEFRQTGAIRQRGSEFRPCHDEQICGSSPIAGFVCIFCGIGI
jgi:hypothetical protein